MAILASALSALPLCVHAVDYSPTTAVQLQADLATAAASGVDNTFNLGAIQYNTSDVAGPFLYLSAGSNALTITGAGAASTILDGGNATGVFQIASSGPVTLSGVTIQRGSENATGGGGLFVNGATINIQNCSFLNNTTTHSNGGGGVIATATTGNVVFSNNTVTGNSTGGVGLNGGGAVVQSIGASSVVTMEGNNFSSNVATGDFGGLYVSAGSSLSFLNNTVSQNTATNSGGGTVNTSTSGITATGNTISNNHTTTGDAAGMVVVASNGLTFSNNTVTQNASGAQVGGVVLNGGTGTSTIESNTITQNTAVTAYGGLLMSQATPVVFNNNNVSNNSATSAYGGALINSGGTVIANGNTVSSNSSTTSHGGIVITASDTVTFNSNTVLSNTTGSFAAGVLSSVGDLQFENNLVAANETTGPYAAFIISQAVSSGPSTLSILNNTVYGNLAPSGIYSGLFVTATDLSITINAYNNILFGNVNDGTPGSAADLTVSNSAGNLNIFNNDIGSVCFTSPSSCDLTALGSDAANNLAGVDPLFINAAAGNYRLQATSTLIDQGLLAAPGLPATDLVGNPRSFLTIPDIGAYEAVAEVLSSSTTLDFGSVSTNDANSIVITLSNNGTYNLNVSALTLSDTTNFALQTNAGANPCGSSSFQIASGASCTLGVEFGPNSVAAFAESLTVTSDAPASPSYVIALTGTGTESAGGCALQSGVANSSALLLLLLPLALTASMRKRRH